MISSSGGRFLMSVGASRAHLSRFGWGSIHRRPTQLLYAWLVEARTGRTGGQPERVVIEKIFHLLVQRPESLCAEYVGAQPMMACTGIFGEYSVQNARLMPMP